MVLVVSLVSLFFLYRLQWTRFGFTLALRTSATEALAESIGINAARHKTPAFVVSCFFCGLMGAVHVHYLRFVSPFVFTFFLSTDLMVYVMVGGLGSYWGPMLATLLLTSLGEQLFAAGYYKSLVYAVVLLVVILALPGSSRCRGSSGAAGASTRRRRPRQRPPRGSAERAGDPRHHQAVRRSHGAPGRGVHGDPRGARRARGSERAGKSTLFNIIAGAFPPTRGQIVFNGRDVTGLTSHDLARLGVARTFQQTTLFGEQTALENVLHHRHRHVPARLLAGLLATPSTGRSSARSSGTPSVLVSPRHRGVSRRDRRRPAARHPEAALGRHCARDRPRPAPAGRAGRGLSHEEATRMMNLVASEIRQRCTVVLVEHNMRIVAVGAIALSCSTSGRRSTTAR